MEAWVAKRLESPHVVKLQSEPGRQTFLYNLFEYVEGQTLGQWMAEHPQPEVKEVRRIVSQVIAGLRGMHRREMLHQDLKPDNVVLHPERGAVIIDMGSCYVAGIDEIEVAYERDAILGTLPYSAPEYRLGRKGTRKSDQFSLGIILYRMFTGRHPYGERFAKAQNLRDFSNLKYQPAFQINPLVPVWVDGVIRRAVQINPDLRYDSFSELLYDLEHPNQAYLLKENLPLLHRGGVDFWRTAALVLLAVEVVTLVWTQWAK
jgi:serine/threonine protein kinase